MNRFLIPFVIITVFCAFSSCKNKRVRTCYLLDRTAFDTIDVYKQEGLFNKYAERNCEQEVERRDTLEEYDWGYFDCDCSVRRK
ncbi:MAG: hypothetical protein ACI8ZM_002909 [Crocinitomix sp.]|jgi:hypothetical protein